ncbi:MAG: hypothetical protein IT454_16255 [Planctomycetes bacterium]|nr:hypothetical protein [Planctomycetota bacterium]
MKLPKCVTLNGRGALAIRTGGKNGARRPLVLGGVDATREELAKALAGVEFSGVRTGPRSEIGRGDLRRERAALVVDALRRSGIALRAEGGAQ